MSPSGAIAGGLGTGSFRFLHTGEFGGWRMEPAQPETPAIVPQDRFHVWARQEKRTVSRPLVANPSTQVPSASLFPLTWTSYPLDSFPLTLESVAFSPLLPGTVAERSLPLYLIVFRAYNPTLQPIEAALMLTWACGWPDPVHDAAFDFQHDNLCLTGSLGSPTSENRQGIAVPDLHYMGIYQQGIEPWLAPDEEEEIVEDFAEDGELDPRVVRSTPHGAAAWVKFDLEPGETKETPFVLTWHFPRYGAGPSTGARRAYTQHLGRYRPDNAIVWLAEQAVQHYGAETANYRYWMQQLGDWQTGLGERATEVCGALEDMIAASTVWPNNGTIGTVDPVYAEKLALANTVWPDLTTG